jgi:hypothetical protein
MRANKNIPIMSALSKIIKKIPIGERYSILKKLDIKGITNKITNIDKNSNKDWEIFLLSFLFIISDNNSVLNIKNLK